MMSPSVLRIPAGPSHAHRLPNVRRQYVNNWNASCPQTSASVSHTGGIESRSARSKLQFSSRCRYSTHSSRLAESLIFGLSNSPPGGCGLRLRENACTALRFVRTVLISPLWLE